jgi:hypothetical protein
VSDISRRLLAQSVYLASLVSLTQPMFFPAQHQLSFDEN